MKDFNNYAHTTTLKKLATFEFSRKIQPKMYFDSQDFITKKEKSQDSY